MLSKFFYVMIIQQDEVISELREYAALRPERAKVLATVKYLSAINIFERTLLGTKTRIFKPEGTGMQCLDEGFTYFREWAEDLISSGEFDRGVDSKQGLVVDFLSTHPGHHINPRRVNGSSVETLFGQLMHTTSGNLTGHRYETANATLLTKRQIQGGKRKDDYRNTLSISGSQNYDGNDDLCTWNVC